MGKCDETSVEVNMGDSASPMKPDNIFTFTVPPEAPVFRPTPEEFLDPLAYINKIRPIAEKSGLCKIKPPPNWQPPFAVDVDRLRFTPRIQRLNELEAITRVKLNFLDQIVKFWELQGSILKIPTVERKPLDLYALHKIVKEAGGFEACSSERKWSKIASRMGHPQGKGVGSILKGHYERILYPYDVFKSTGATDIKLECEEVAPDAASAAADVKPTRRWKKLNSEPESEHEGSQTEGALAGADNYKDKKTPTKQDSDTENKRALRESPTKRLLFHNAMQCSRPTRSSRALREHRQSNMTVSVAPAPPTISPDDPLAKYICHNCARGDVEEQMLLCDGCDDSYHTFCLLPPLADVPKGDWRCPRCIAQEVSKPTEAFGFEQARREYTLTQFGEMADQFKSEYFNMPVHMVPTSTVEKEFWRIVSSIDEDVTVEYGADLHSMDHGSGFPTKASQSQYPVDQDYAESSWNLNNLPLLEGSVLGHINADISGMKIPWMYVGMCFATFCWHNEDHWSYSINYLHWGEPKTWYGVPGSKAEQFETTMRSAAPELFQWQPDLLHQLVTIMNPNILMSAGVPVYRTDQHAGEFVITFPRAYHAGFNQGYNFAEAVNFTPADWLKIGRECITHYSNLRRYCVFSHDELVCKMALEADNLGLTVALATYQDMRQMLSDERKLRKSLLEWGVTEAEREAYELLPDDARQCYLCKTTCFLSAVSCACTENIACLRHYTALCKCPPQKHRLRYRYTLDELPLMIEKLKEKSDAFREWADAVQNALDPDTPKTCDLDGLRAHLKKAHELKMHKTDLVRALEMAIEDTEKCASVIHQLDLNKMRTRTRNRDTSADPKYRLTVEELTLFCEEIDGLACVLPEGSAVKEVLRQTAEFESRAGALLRTKLGTPASVGASVARELDACVERGQQLCIQLPQLPKLVARQQQVKFLEEVRVLREDYDQLTLEVMSRLLEVGAHVQPHYAVEAQLAYLQTLKGQVEEWEKKARDALTPMSSLPPRPPRPPPEGSDEEEESQHMSLSELDALLNESDSIEAALPSQQQLSTAVSHAKDWLSKVEEMQSKESYPYYHTLEALVRKGQTIPLRLYEKDSLANALTSARQWKELTAKTFMRRSWQYSLMEALSPRTDILSAPTPSPRAPARPATPAGPPAPSCLEAGLFMQHFSEESSPTEIVAAFKAAEEKEMANMRELRAKNLRKDVRGPPQPGVTFCLCQKRQYGVMTQCELCKDWFHASCMSYRSSSPSPPPSPTAGVEGADEAEDTPAPPPPLNLPFPNRDPKFMCPTCLRTKRPRLETILGLLVSLQRLPVRLAEGEALQCVTERAMAWQDAARTALGAREVAAAVARAQARQRASSTQGDAHAAQYARERERQLTNELRKVTGRAGHESLMAAHTSRNPPASEHAYSASPRSPAPAESGSFRARLPPHQVHRLEDLMMEGDLLEVNLDETAHVWNVLSAARGPRDPPSRLSVWSSASATAAAERAGAGAARMKRRAGAGAATQRAPTHNKRQRQQLGPPAANVVKVSAHKKRRGGAAPNERKLAGSQAPTTTNYLNRKQGLSSGSGLMMKKHYLARQERRRRGLVKAPKPFKATRGRRGAGAGAGAPRMRRGAPRLGPGAPRGRSRSASASSRGSSAEDEEDCAAHTCLRPTGKEVDWVQCDGGCDKWFHLHCVGLNKNSLKEDEDYYCVACKRKN